MPPPGFRRSTQPGSSSPTLLGWVVQFLLLCFFFALNYYSVKTFARSNNFISVRKFLVPLLVVVTLFAFFKPENLHSGDCAIRHVRGGSGDQRGRNYLRLSGTDAGCSR